MPVEIMELIVRANVQESAATESASDSGGQGGNADQKTIIEECVEQVLKILQRREER